LLLQDFVPHGEAGFVPVNDFEFILSFVAKDKNGVIEGR
jgi:hypothetical protein